MLDPPRARSVCSGGPFGPSVDVEATLDGRKTHLGGRPGCDWPGGASAGVYSAAADGDHGGYLDAFESHLRCDEDPRLLAQPTPWTLVRLCELGSTLSTRREIFIEAAAGKTGLGAVLRYPARLGWQTCPTRVDRSPGRPAGRCRISVKKVWGTPTVTLVQTWPRGNGTARHTWRVRVGPVGATVVAQSGPTPPQLRR